MVDPEEVFDLLADDYAREILAHANRKPMSVRDLTTACDAHHSTIYRRLERLQALDLLSEHLHVDIDGHHHAVYETTLAEMTVTLNDDDFHVQLRIEEDPVDRLAQMWRDIREEEP